MKKKTKPLLFILIVLIVLIISASFLFVKIVLSPSTDSNSITIEIKDNWYGKDVLNCLEDNEIIKSADVVYYYAKIKGLDLNFKAGTYIVDSSWELTELINYLNDASNALQDTVTIKFGEGTRVKDFANELSENTNLEYQDIIDYWNDESIIRSYMADYAFMSEEMFQDDVKYLLEGYLFPDTYEFYVNTSIEDVTTKILDKTQDIYEKYFTYFYSSEYTVHELFTLASIVQRESGNKNDMKDIASVFYNRLDIGMGLQSSVTVCYALDIGLGGDWTKCEIVQDDLDPYNTYEYLGLPPGAICSPGEDAIDAVLNPNQTDYYYFIGDVCGDGTTYFAETYEEQLNNQARYLTCY